MGAVIRTNKVAAFAPLCDELQRDGRQCVIIRSPADLGDTHADVMASLEHLAAAGASLMILPPDCRDPGHLLGKYVSTA